MLAGQHFRLLVAIGETHLAAGELGHVPLYGEHGLLHLGQAFGGLLAGAVGQADLVEYRVGRHPNQGEDGHGHHHLNQGKAALAPHFFCSCTAP